MGSTCGGPRGVAAEEVRLEVGVGEGEAHAGVDDVAGEIGADGGGEGRVRELVAGGDEGVEGLADGGAAAARELGLAKGRGDERGVALVA